MWTALALLGCTPPAPPVAPTGATGATGDTGASTAAVQPPLQFEGSGFVSELGSSVVIVPSNPPWVVAGEPGFSNLEYESYEVLRTVRAVDPTAGSERTATLLASSQDWYGYPYNAPWRTHFGQQLLSPGDVTGNGELDLVVFDDNLDTNPGAFVFEGPLVAGAVSRSHLDGIPFEALVPWRGAACGDLTGDGIAEVCTAIGIVVGPITGPITAFDTSWSALTPTEDIRIAAADLDGSGVHDLLVSDQGANTVFRLTSIPAGDHDLAAISASSWTAPETPTVLEAGGDLDGDGLPDLIVAWGGTTPTLVVDTGLGGDLVAAHTTLGVDAVAATTGDFDGDGTDDLAVGLHGEVLLFLGPLPAGPLARSDADHVLVGWESPEDAFGTAMDAGDVDGDGDAELAVGAPYDGNDLGSGRGKVYVFDDPMTFDWALVR